MHAVGKLLGLLVVGQLAFHPDGVAVGRVRHGAVDGAVAAALQAVVALARARGVPVEVDVGAEHGAGGGAGLGVGKAAAGDGGAVAVGQGAGVRVGAGGDGGQHGVVEAHQAGLREPGVLDGLQRVARLAGALGRRHQVVERLQVRVGAAQDEGVVARVDGGGDEGGGLGVGAGDGEEVGSWEGLVGVAVQVEGGREVGRNGWMDGGYIPIMSACARMATRRLMCSLMGTRTLPAMCPHFLVPGAWSSMWMPAAPFSMNSFVSFMTAVRPPWPVSASAMMGRR